MKIQSLPQPLVIGDQLQQAGNKAGGLGFGEALNNAISKLNDASVHSSEMRLKFITGEIQDIHQVTIAAQEAKIALHLAVEVRNKILEAYQEVSRMPL